MKNMKKLLSVFLAAMMMLSLVAMAGAVEGEQPEETPQETEEVKTITPPAGDGKIIIENALIGETYAAYKVFGATYNTDTKSVAYTIEKGAGENGSAWYQAVAASNLFTLTASGTDGVYNVTRVDSAGNDAILDFVKANAGSFEKVAQIKATENKVEWSVPYGYYYIKSSMGAVVTVDDTTPEAKVIDKNDSIPSAGDDMKKIVLEGANNTETLVDKTVAAVGDTVKFRVKVNTVNYAVTTDEKGTVHNNLVTRYTITDKPENMEINLSSVVVEVGDEKEALADGTDYTASVDGTTGALTVVVKWAEADAPLHSAPNTLTVIYTAEITEKAAVENAANSAAASYNDGIAFGPEGGDKVEVDTYSFHLLKYDAKDADKKVLKGAQFALYDAETDGSLIKLVAVNANGAVITAENTEDTVSYYRPATPDEQNAAGFQSAIIKAGTADIKGLDDTGYYLEEINAPEGYNKLTARQEVELNANRNGYADAEVANSTGLQLPSTGGIGTTIFTVVGASLMVGAAVLFVTKKRAE